MQLTMPPPIPQPMKPVTMPPAVQASLHPAAVAAAATAQPQATQTAQAPQAMGKADAGRRNMAGTDTGQSKDTLANAINAQTNRTAAGAPRPRGSLLNLSV
jgi:hypothetical protein